MKLAKTSTVVVGGRWVLPLVACLTLFSNVANGAKMPACTTSCTIVGTCTAEDLCSTSCFGVCLTSACSSALDQQLLIKACSGSFSAAAADKPSSVAEAETSTVKEKTKTKTKSPSETGRVSAGSKDDDPDANDAMMARPGMSSKSSSNSSTANNSTDTGEETDNSEGNHMYQPAIRQILLGLALFAVGLCWL